MAALDFPASPTVGQRYAGWTWNGTVWLPSSASVMPLGIRVFPATSTYVPSTGVVGALVECVGCGAGGNGSVNTAAGIMCYAGGGGSGGYSRKWVTAAQIGASQSITVATPGAGGVAGGYGGAGGDVSFGTLCIARGAPSPNDGSGLTYVAGVGAPAGVGDLAFAGNAGGGGANLSGSGVEGGHGGASVFGGSPTTGLWTPSNLPGKAGLSPGAGGSGGFTAASGAGQPGGAGAAGVCIVTEFVSSVPVVWTQQAPQSGARVLLLSQTVSTPVSSIVFTNAGSQNGFSNVAFDELQLECINYSTDANVNVGVQVSQDGGSTFDTAANYAAVYQNMSSASASPAGGNGTLFPLFVGTYNSGAGPNSGYVSILRLWRPWSTALQKNVWFQGNGYQTTPTIYQVSGSGCYPALGLGNMNAITGLRCMLTSGNFTKGTFKLYGVMA